MLQSNTREAKAAFHFQVRINRRRILNCLKQLSLANRIQITSNGLRHLTRLSELDVLAINGTSVSGEGLQHIPNVQKLKGLTLDDSPLISSRVA